MLGVLAFSPTLYYKQCYFWAEVRIHFKNKVSFPTSAHIMFTVLLKMTSVFSFKALEDHESNTMTVYMCVHLSVLKRQ